MFLYLHPFFTLFSSFRQRTDLLSLPVGVGAPTTRTSLSHPPLVNISTSAPFAFSCWRRGTAERWMRSNALPYSKTSTEGKTPHPSAFSCHLLPPEKAYLYPRPFLPSLADLPSTHLHRLSPCRGRRPDDPHALPFARLPSQKKVKMFVGVGAPDDPCALPFARIPSRKTVKTALQEVPPHRAIQKKANRVPWRRAFFFADFFLRKNRKIFRKD